MKWIIGYTAVVISLVLMTWGTVFAEKTVVTVEGKYVMGDLDTKQNAKVLALMEAKRLSLEKAGTYVESLSEVKDYQLTKDQINSLASGIMSIEILKEDWLVSGQSMVVILSVRATIDTSDLKARIAAMQDYRNAESTKEIKAQLAALQKELAELKAQPSVQKEKESPKQQDLQKKNVGIVNEIWALKSIEEGYAALHVQRYGEAVAAFQNALESNAARAEAYAGMSIAYGGLKQRDKAIDAADKALKIDPKSASGQMAMSRIKFSDREYEQALLYVNLAIDRYPKSPYYYFHRGDIYLKLHNADEATRNFEKACSMGLPTACRRADIAKKRLAAFIKKDGTKALPPEKPEPLPKNVRENMKKGYEALQNQRYAEAIAAFQGANNLDPSLAEPYGGLSIAYYWTKDMIKAKDMADKALALDPHSTTGLYARSRILYEEASYDKALESINRAIDTYAKSPVYVSFRADIYMKLQNREMALKNYTQACAMNYTPACQRMTVLKTQMKGTKKK